MLPSVLKSPKAASGRSYLNLILKSKTLYIFAQYHNAFKVIEEADTSNESDAAKDLLGSCVMYVHLICGFVVSLSTCGQDVSSASSSAPKKSSKSQKSDAQREDLKRVSRL